MISRTIFILCGGKLSIATKSSRSSLHNSSPSISLFTIELAHAFATKSAAAWSCSEFCCDMIMENIRYPIKCPTFGGGQDDNSAFEGNCIPRVFAKANPGNS